jgi:hypothetical protein
MKIKMAIEFSGNFAASATETQSGSLILLSRVDFPKAQLVLVQHVDVRNKLPSFLRSVISNFKGCPSLNSRELRNNFSSDWGRILTEHLYQVLSDYEREYPDADVVALTAWYYQNLVDWGEASPARELSLRWKIPVRTVQNRLRIARDRGILHSPGRGSRLAK